MVRILVQLDIAEITIPTTCTSNSAA